MATITVTGWAPGVRTISFMKLLREGSQSGRTLAEAKSMVDGLLEGRPFTVSFDSPEEAGGFVASARDLGVLCQVKALKD